MNTIEQLREVRNNIANGVIKDRDAKALTRIIDTIGIGDSVDTVRKCKEEIEHLEARIRYIKDKYPEVNED